MQFIWKYIDDLAGKGLEAHVIAELLLYASASLVPLALPLAILLSSIMTFGSMAENLELVACKSAGISLIRVMRPLIVTSVITAFGAFYFSNYVMPVASLKMRALIVDIQKQKPAIDIQPGIFYSNLKGLVIRINTISNDKKELQGVMVYDHTDRNNGNSRVTLAETGRIEITPDERFLTFRLRNGVMYDEQGFFRNRDLSYPLIQTYFKEQIFLVDLSDFKLSRNSEGMYKDHYTMMNVAQLGQSIREIRTEYRNRIDEYGISMKKTYFFGRKTANEPLNPFRREDSLKIAAVRVINPLSAQTIQSPSAEFIAMKEPTGRKIVTLADFKTDAPLAKLTSNEKGQVLDIAISVTQMNRKRCEDFENELKFRNENQARYEAEWHKKFTLSLACLVLFFVGAPLGAIIRKGGLGLPLVASILIFIFYYVLSTIGEKAVKQLTMSPMTGMWLSTVVLIPVGIFLTIKASNDSKLFDPSAWKKRFSSPLKSKT